MDLVEVWNLSSRCQKIFFEGFLWATSEIILVISPVWSLGMNIFIPGVGYMNSIAGMSLPGRQPGAKGGSVLYPGCVRR